MGFALQTLVGCTAVSKSTLTQQKLLVSAVIVFSYPQVSLREGDTRYQELKNLNE